MYVMVLGINPLRIYVYRDGIARLATIPYRKPDKNNLDQLNMHLTNFAINKDHENFEANVSAEAADVGSKRSMKSVFEGI